jgi:hypothetical protein
LEGIIIMDRRGFLAALLAASVAPAYVRASSLMPIVVPSKEIILPHLAINFPNAIPGSEYTFSMYMKVKGNQWERVERKMVADKHGVINEKVQLYHQEQTVSLVQITSNQITPQSGIQGGMNMRVTGNNDCKLLVDSTYNPSSKENAFSKSRPFYNNSWNGKKRVF